MKSINICLAISGETSQSQQSVWHQILTHHAPRLSSSHIYTPGLQWPGSWCHDDVFSFYFYFSQSPSSISKRLNDLHCIKLLFKAIWSGPVKFLLIFLRCAFFKVLFEFFLSLRWTSVYFLQSPVGKCSLVYHGFQCCTFTKALTFNPTCQETKNVCLNCLS